MMEIQFHFITGKVLVFNMNSEEYDSLRYCLDEGVKWFMLSDDWLNLDQVVLVTPA